MASIGDIIGSYRLVEQLDCGGFGCVYRGEHTILTNRIVAIKLMHAKYLNSEKMQDDFLQEARWLESLKHPHILPIIDVNTHQGLPYLVTEFAPNGSLKDRLKLELGKTLPVEEAVSILSQIGEALHYAHQQNIVHRDLKPGNILFNTRDEALLADFGIAIGLDRTSVVDEIGTIAYMAPEQFGKIVSKKSDQYALGCIAYELFTGQRPFVAFDERSQIAPTQHNPHLPAHIEQAILTAMAKKREDRHANVATFIQALQQPNQTSDFTDLNKLEAYARREGYWACLEQVRAAHENAERLRTGEAEQLGRVERWLDRESYLLGNGMFWPAVLPGLFYQQLSNRSVEEGQPLPKGVPPARWVQQEGQVGAEDPSLLRIFAGHTGFVTSVAFALMGGRCSRARMIRQLRQRGCGRRAVASCCVH